MRRPLLSAAALIVALAGAPAKAQVLADTGWTYQGKLNDNGSPATGTYDMKFSMFLDDQGTLPTGTVLDVPGVTVNGGLFTTRLDFGVQFTGYKNWLQIEISPAGAGTYTALPLQEITSAPQSLFSLRPWATDGNFNISYTDGLVGIGTTTPSRPLTVATPINSYGISHQAGPISFSTYLGGGGNGAYIGTSSNHPLHFYANDSDPLMTVTPTRLVGVGTTNPNAKFHLYDPQSVTHLVETGGGTNSWSKSIYRNLNGGWEVGTSRGFNGDSFYIYRAGAATIALSVLPSGLTQVRTLQILGGSDLAEPFNVNTPAETEAQPGMVVIIDQDKPGELCLTDKPYDTKVAGIISGANGLAPGMIMKADDAEYTNGKHPVAMTGRVWCYVDASFGAIKPGDRLTTSATAGHAMKADDQARSGGAVIGKAMTELKEGKGLVLVLVNLQ
jgi:hypothetical protein